ncbi:myelin regulatory factor-like isoform X2 [Acropora millepora]|nr:myelin regulatory factor-like isoform X2 [Acropora millepora]
MLPYTADGDAASGRQPINIPNIGVHHMVGNSLLTPPDSDSADSPEANQVFLDTSCAHSHSLSQVPHCANSHPDDPGGAINHACEEMLSRTSSVCFEPQRKRKRSSESGEMTNGLSSLRLMSSQSESDDCYLDSASSVGTDSPDPLTTTATCDQENTYQCLKWSTFKSDEYCNLYDETTQALPLPQFRVDADKGFTYSFSDEAFVCQKKNHLQVTAYLNLQSDQCPKFVQGEEKELRRIEKFRLHIYGIKMESQASRISVEQSQADRSKRHYEPLEFHVSPKSQAKVTVGRLHFSETTANNMRKKGKPNPDQRYFMLVIAVYAHTKNKDFLVCANVSERIIVRASNPAQFENDMDAVWTRGQSTESIYRMGRVGVNTAKPEEALSVHGNLKLTGRLVHPSDKRVKESIEEVDTREQLRNVSKMKLYRYRYSREYLEHAGLTTEEFELEDTGVLAQEMKEVLPEAVSESEDLVLSDGKTIERFLVVNKERIFMENVGAVKELCKLTDSLEVRIDELETMNQRLQRRRCDSFSTFSSLNVSRASSFRASVNSKTPNKKSTDKGHSHCRCHHHHHHCACKNQGVRWEEQTMCSPKLMLLIIIILVVIAVLCTMGIVIVVISKGGHITADPPSEKGGTGPSPSVAASGQNSPSDPTTTQPSKSNSPSRSSTGYTSTTTSSEMFETGGRNSANKTVVRKTEVCRNKSTQTKTFEEDPTTMFPRTRARGNDKEKHKAKQCCNVATDHSFNETIIRGLEVFPPSSKIGSPNTHVSAASDSGSVTDVKVGFRQYDFSIYCEGNCSETRRYFIPFKPDLLPQEYILEINSTSNSVLLHCTDGKSVQRCPGTTDVPQDTSENKNQRAKKTHKWKVYFSYTDYISYHFELHFAPMAENVSCGNTPGSNGLGFSNLYFHFIRKC